MTVQQKEIKWTVQQIKNESKKLHFDLAIQRNKVWKSEQKSLLIHSLLENYPIPPAYCLDRGDDELWFLDGKQRLTSVIDFLDDRLKLSANTPDATVMIDGEEKTYQIAGKLYWELPEELRNVLDNATLTFVQMSNVSDVKRDSVFHRLNNGTGLKPIELTRVLVGSNVMEVVHKISSKSFFQNSLNLTKSNRERFTDEEIIMQIWSLVETNQSVSVDNDKERFTNLQGVELGSVAVRKFTSSKKKEGISDDVVSILDTVSDYLVEAFPVEEDFLKKINIPMLFMVAWKYALPNEISPSKFGGWAQEFFAKQTKESRYRNAAANGSAKKENVKQRLDAITSDYKRHIKDAPEYSIPTPKVVGTRGRKKGSSKKTTQKAVAEAEKASQEIAASQTEEIKTLQENPMWSDETNDNQKQEEVNGQGELSLTDEKVDVTR